MLADPGRGWNGVFTGTVTPFDDEGEIDWASFERHLASFSGSRVPGVIVNGEMGEGSLLDAEEQDRVLKVAVDQIGEQIPVLTSVIAGSTRNAAARAARAADLGAKGLLVFPSVAFRGGVLDAKSVSEFFETIGKVSGLPLIAYQTAADSGFSFDREVLRSIAEIEEVRAIKEGSWDIHKLEDSVEICRAADVAVLVDYDTELLAGFRAGGDGATVATAVVETDSFIDLFEHHQDSRGTELQRCLQPLVNEVFRSPFRDFRARLKALLRMDGVIRLGHVRGPLRSLSDSDRQSLDKAYEKTRYALAELGSQAKGMRDD